MKSYTTNNLRNVGLVGHSGAGKTTLTEAILYYTKTIDRLGKVEEGNTTSDYDIEEKSRKISIGASIIPIEWNGIKINLLDTPGYFDFEGETFEALRAVDMALIMVSGVSGIKVGTEKAWNRIDKNNLPRAFYINKLDRENSDFDKVVMDLKTKFGMSVVPVQYPIGSECNFKGIVDVISNKAKVYNDKMEVIEQISIPEDIKDKVIKCKNMIEEAVAETDEKLLDKYFSNGGLSNEDIYRGLIKGCINGEIAPVMCGSSFKCIGIQSLLENIKEFFPSPDISNDILVYDIKDKSKHEIHINNKKDHFSAFAFKTMLDPFVGKLSLLRIITGDIRPGEIIYNVNKNKHEKIGSMYFLRGRQQIPAYQATAGDIVAIPKLQFTSTGDTINDGYSTWAFKSIKFPDIQTSMAIIPKTKNDEDKILNGLKRLMEEDKTFRISRNIENGQTIISGIGEMHLDIIASKLKSKFGANVILEEPKILYRETIKGVSEVQGKYKKQSGGHGQYGDVKIRFEPRKDGEMDLEFVNEIVGGAVPKQYIPSVEKGLRECINKGILAGYPVIGLKATLYDGSYHSVDSSEAAFKAAAAIAYKKGLLQANPILLEPIMYVEIEIPKNYLGDIMADINRRRGKVLGMGSSLVAQIITAEIPQAEMINYITDLRSMTQSWGSFKMKFQRYEEIPEEQLSKITDNINQAGQYITK